MFLSSAGRSWKPMLLDSDLAAFDVVDLIGRSLSPWVSASSVVLGGSTVPCVMLRYLVVHNAGLMYFALV